MISLKSNGRPEPRVDMKELVKRIEETTAVVQEFAPKNHVPPDAPVIEHIARFGELPTKEIDDVIAAAEAEIADLKRDAQAVRDLYSKYTAKLIEDTKRLREGVRLSMETMKQLRDQCQALDDPPKFEVKELP
jgi:hypothetical protein